MPFTIEITEGGEDFEIVTGSWEETEEWIDYLDSLADIDYEWEYTEA